MKVNIKKKKNAGFIVTLELLLVSTILVIGLITGLVAVRDAVVTELQDSAQAIQSINQSYTYDGLIYRPDGPCTATTAGSVFVDNADGRHPIVCIAPSESDNDRDGGLNP